MRNASLDRMQKYHSILVAATDLVVGPQEVKESLCGKVYLRLEFFQPLFGINVTYDEEKNCYELSTVMPQ